MIRAIVLDIGGVVLRTEDRSGRQALEEKHGLPPGGVDALVFGSQAAAESSIGRSDPEKIWQNVADTLSLSPEALVDFQQIFWQGDQIDQEIINFFRSLRVEFITAFLTNAWTGARQTLANIYDIVEGVTADHILISSELGLAKPDTQIYHILSETIDVGFDQILFVDDFIENIAAAKALGIHTIHYKAGMDLIAHIENRVIPS